MKNDLYAKLCIYSMYKIIISSIPLSKNLYECWLTFEYTEYWNICPTTPVLRVQVWMGRRLRFGIRASCNIYLLHTLWVIFGCVVCFRMINCVHSDYACHWLSFPVVWLISFEMHCLIHWLGFGTCLFGTSLNTVQAMTVMSGD